MGLLKETAHSYYSGTDLGSYQFISLEHVINNFMISYVGEGKIIPKVKRTDVMFHAKRALQELSYDTFKSIKSQEITLPPSLTMMLPQDYVNYVKLIWSDDNGIERIIYPTSKTSNPNSIAQDSDGNYTFTTDKIDLDSTGSPEDIMQFPLKLELTQGLDVSQSTVTLYPHMLGFDPTTDVLTTNTGHKNFPDENPFKADMEIISPYFPPGTTIDSIQESSSTDEMTITFSHESTNTSTVSGPIILTIIDNTSGTTWGKYKSASSNQATIDKSVNTNPAVDADIYHKNVGQRYGLDPQYAQANGSFFIDQTRGVIHFSSNISGKQVILKYISDSLGTEGEMQVHKFAEEAMYKHIAYAITSTTTAGLPIAAALKKERFAETRKAKLRLSNLKIEELTQVMRGKSKHIKH